MTAIDTRPLAPSVERIVGEAQAAFRAGLRVLLRLTRGTVYLCGGDGAELPRIDAERLRVVTFRGPHPAGIHAAGLHQRQDHDARERTADDALQHQTGSEADAWTELDQQRRRGEAQRKDGNDRHPPRRLMA